MNTQTKTPHALLLSSPGIGHLIPVLELGKRLHTKLNFHVTIFAVHSRTSVAESEIIKSASSLNSCHVIGLPPPNITNLVGPDAKPATVLRVMMREIRPAVRAAIRSMASPPTVMIVDLFGTESVVIADELHIPKYFYIASHAWFLALTLYIPTLDKLVKGDYTDKTDPFDIPGCKPIRPLDVVDPMLDRTDQHYVEYLKMSEEMLSFDGVLVNTWEDLQPEALSSLRDEKLLGGFFKSRVYAIGPIVRELEQVSSSEELLEWLDRQPRASVVFVSFGSGGTLSRAQLSELAWGLELSQQRFIWVVRTPTMETGNGSFFTAGTHGADVSRFLPDGFLTRTRDIGIVVPDWAPQLEILSHVSIGAFLSHCGWNSVLESLSNGVAMIAWPLYAEQKMNATMLVEELGVAVRTESGGRVVGREEVKRMVRRVMADEEGNVIRKKVNEIKRSAERAQMSEGGGSSYKSLALFAEQCQLKSN